MARRKIVYTTIPNAPSRASTSKPSGSTSRSVSSGLSSGSSDNFEYRLGPASYVNNATGEDTAYRSSGSSKKTSSLEDVLAAQLENQRSSLAAQRRREEEALRSAQDAQKTAVGNAYSQSRSNVNSQTEEALRQAYINSMLQERDFPQQAALWGEGGFAESNLASLRNQAQENRNQLEMQRSSQLGALESDYNTQLAGIESSGIGQLSGIANNYSSALANAENSYQNNLYSLLSEQARMQQERELAAINAANKGTQNNQTARKTSLNDLYNAHDYYTKIGDSAGANAIRQQINDYLGVTNTPTQPAGRGYLAEVEEQLSMFGTAQAAASYLASLYNQGLLNDSEISYLQARIR